MEVKEQRKHQRCQTEDQNVQAKIASAKMVKILDISIGGVLLQTDKRLNISKEYTIRIEHNGKLYPVKGAIIWSVLKECKSDQQGNSIPIYQSGMQLLNIPEEFISLISLIGKNQKQKENDAVSTEEYYSLSIDALDMSSKERKHLESNLSSVYGH